MNSSVLANLLKEEPIVVSGLGAFCAAGRNVGELWAAAEAGRVTARLRDFPTRSGTRRYAACSAVDPDSTTPLAHASRKMDRAVQLAAMAAAESLRQARLDRVSPERIGVVVGSSRGPLGKVIDSVNQLERKRLLPSLAADSTFSSLSGALAQALGFGGPCATVSAACASGASAIAFAAEQIVLGKADVMLAGASEAPLSPVVLAQLESAGVLAEHADPAQACRPFDARRNGLVLGEGSGFLVLERAGSARARGATSLARLAGWSLATDHAGRSAVTEDGSALFQTMMAALRIAGLSPEAVDYVNAHGTATRLNDVVEARAMNRVFSERAGVLPCSSTKPVTGHCLGATPALEAILCVETLRRGRIVPTANCEELDPECAIHPVAGGALDRSVAVALSNSLGFWGYHASLVFTQP